MRTPEKPNARTEGSKLTVKSTDSLFATRLRSAFGERSHPFRTETHSARHVGLSKMVLPLSSNNDFDSLHPQLPDQFHRCLIVGDDGVDF